MAVVLPQCSVEDKSDPVAAADADCVSSWAMGPEEAGMNWDDDLAKPKRALVLGEDLERFAVVELEERIGALEAEIGRVRREIAAKQAHKAAAAKLFDD